MIPETNKKRMFVTNTGMRFYCMQIMAASVNGSPVS